MMILECLELKIYLNKVIYNIKNFKIKNKQSIIIIIKIVRIKFQNQNISIVNQMHKLN